MPSDRREFLRHAAGAGLALGLGLAGGSRLRAAPSGPAAPGPAASPETAGRSRAIRILILGGTGFIGPHQVRAARDGGHEITLFNRGRTNPGMFPDIEQLRGDRNGDLDSLRGRTWDMVIDNSTARPDWVTLSAELLRDSVGLYCYVSSRSAYADYSTVPMTSDAPTHTYETAGVDRATADITRLPYGLAKAESEREAMRIFGDRCAIFRPGLIVGPGDETDRFTYWPVRIHRGGEVLSPGPGTDPVQVIDVRDLAEFMIRAGAAGHAGRFTCVGPASPRPMAELLYGIRAVTTAETTFTWVDTDFLLERDVRPYREMPVWRPPQPGFEGFARFDLSNEIAHGLAFRSLADTTAATLEYHFSRPADRQAALRAGLSAGREAEVLEAWHVRM